MAIFEATPDGAARGAVIVVQEAFGVNAHIRDVTTRFAAAGYHAVAPAYFHRAGGGAVEDYSDFSAIFPLFEGLTDDGILADTAATLDHLRAAGFADGQVGIVGFCFGGRVTFLASLEWALGAGVGFYGGGIATKGVLPFPALVERTAALQTPWLGLFGDQDGSIPVADVEHLREALGAASVDAAVVRYAEAEHGFHCDARDSYHEASAEDAWGRTLAWFDAHLD
ncbi:MAG: dienelactone hydrolase family protein [Actinobacteria bacterium]|nr:dienelactone hydrolase family protein [Actinomycetota bacterium]